MNEKPVFLATTAHYKLNLNGLSQKEKNNILVCLDPNKKYGQILSCFYNYCLSGYVGTGCMLTKTYRNIQKRTLIKTPKGYEAWSFRRTILPVPKDIKENCRVVLPKSFIYKGHFQSASAVFNLKLQTLMQEQEAREFHIGDKELEYLLSHYKALFLPGAKRSKKRIRKIALRSNLEKGYFHRIRGKGNKYKLSKENEHLYEHILGNNAVTKPQETEHCVSHSIEPSPSDLYALSKETAERYGRRIKERPHIQEQEETKPLIVQWMEKFFLDI